MNPTYMLQGHTIESDYEPSKRKGFYRCIIKVGKDWDTLVYDYYFKNPKVSI